jgi:hypothetical protein
LAKLFRNEFHDGFGTWPLAYIPYGGVDFGEIRAVAEAVGDGDDGAFYNAWVGAADRLKAQADIPEITFPWIRFKRLIGSAARTFARHESARFSGIEAGMKEQAAARHPQTGAHSRSWSSSHRLRSMPPP